MRRPIAEQPAVQCLPPGDAQLGPYVSESMSSPTNTKRSVDAGSWLYAAPRPDCTLWASEPAKWCACGRARGGARLCAVQAVVSEVFGLPLDWGADHQELRQLTRGAQQVWRRLCTLPEQRCCQQRSMGCTLLRCLTMAGRGAQHRAGPTRQACFVTRCMWSRLMRRRRRRRSRQGQPARVMCLCSRPGPAAKAPSSGGYFELWQVGCWRGSRAS